MSANYGSFCTWSIFLENGQEIRWEGDQEGCALFDAIPSNARKVLKNMHSIQELLAFITDCYYDKDEAQDFMNTDCSAFRDEILAIPSFEDITTISLSWGVYYADDGYSPKEGCTGESLVYHPKDGKCRISHKPEEWFVEEMESIYGYLFGDEEDEWDEEDE